MGRRDMNRTRDFAFRSPSVGKPRESAVRSPTFGAEPAIVCADESRRQLHAAAVKVQSLFRGNRVRKLAQGEGEVPESTTGRSKARSSSRHSFSKPSGYDARLMSDAFYLGQPSETMGAARMQPRMTRGAQQPRCRTLTGPEIRERASRSPQAQQSPFGARQMFGLGPGSRLQVNGRAVSRRAKSREAVGHCKT